MATELDERKKKTNFGDAAAPAGYQQIPTGGNLPAPPAVENNSTEFSRNFNNSANALGGMGVVASVPLRSAQSAMSAAPLLPNAMPRLAAPAANATNFVAGMGSGAQVAAAPVTAAAQAIPRLPAVNAALQEGAQANALAGVTRGLLNAGALLAGSEQAQGATPVSPANPASGIPTTGYPAAPLDDGRSTTELSRNIQNGANALGGIGAVASAPMRSPQGAMGALAGATRGASNSSAYLAGAVPVTPVSTTPAAPSEYGRQMGEVGNFIANGVAAAAKTIVGAPGYGINQTATSAPSASPVQPVPTGTATAGAGRGYVNPPMATNTAVAAPVVAPPVANPAATANPNQITATRQPNGVMSFSGGPNIGKDGGEISYTGNSGFKQSGFGVSTVPGMSREQIKATLGGRSADQTFADNAIRAANLRDGVDMNRGVDGNGPTMSVIGDGSGFGILDKGYQERRNAGFALSSITASKQQKAEAIQSLGAIDRRTEQSAALAADASGRRMTDATTRRGQDAQNAMANAQNTLATAKFGLDQRTSDRAGAGIDLDNKAKQRLADVQGILMNPNATDAQREKATETGRALQGKYEKEVPDLFATTPIPFKTDPMTGQVSGGGAIVTDKRTGATRIISADEAKGPPAAAPSRITTKAEFDKLPAGTLYINADGKTYKK